MNKYVKLAAMATTTAVMGMSSMAMAETPAPPEQAERFFINGGGKISVNQDGDVDAEILAQMVFQLSETAKIEITSDLQEVYDGVVDDDFDLDDAIKEGKVSFETVQLGPVERVVLAIKMDIDRINMSALDPDYSLQGSGVEGVAALRLYMKPSYLDSMVVTLAENNSNEELDVDTGSARMSLRAAKAMGMVMIEGEVGYTWNDVAGDDYDGTLAIGLDLDEHVTGLDLFAQGTATGNDGLTGYELGANYDFNNSWTLAGAYEKDEKKDQRQVRVGLSKTRDNGHIVSGSVAMDLDTEKEELRFQYEIPTTNLFKR